MDVINQFEHFQFNAVPLESLNKDSGIFRDALNLLVNGRNKEAEERFLVLFKTSEDEKLKNMCANFLFDSYFSQGKWAEIDHLELLQNEAIDKNNRIIAKVCRQFKEKTYTFIEESVTIPVTLSASGSPTAELIINGQRKCFWLDTGAGMTVISSTVAEACGIHLEKSNFKIEASTNESLGANLACVDQIVLGGVTVRNQPAVILSDELLVIKNPKTNREIIIEGIIGWDVLKDLYLEINYADKHLTIKKPRLEENSTSSANLFFSGFPIVKINSDNNMPLFFGFDSGAEFTHFGQSLLAKLPDLKVYRRNIQAGGVGGYKEIVADIIEDLSLFLVDQPINIKNSRMVLLEYATFFKLDGVLGSDSCQNGTLIIDYPNRKMELKRA